MPRSAVSIIRLTSFSNKIAPMKLMSFSLLAVILLFDILVMLTAGKFGVRSVMLICLMKCPHTCVALYLVTHMRSGWQLFHFSALFMLLQPQTHQLSHKSHLLKAICLPWLLRLCWNLRYSPRLKRFCHLYSFATLCKRPHLLLKTIVMVLQYHKQNYWVKRLVNVHCVPQVHY